jgi:thiol-disulfide isomerase/thioredoxin
MKITLTLFGCLLSLLMAAEEPKTLEIGAKAPAFSLKGTDEKMYTLQSFKSSKILVVIFTCNHCPTAQAYEDRMIQLVKDYKSKGVAFVAVSPNNPDAVRLDELGYSDMGDSFKEMKKRAKEKKYNFPYLYDGDKQAMANAYGPVVTPHVFIFDNERILRFQGRIDDVEKPSGTPNHHDTRNAIEALLQSTAVATPTTKVFGCSIKWATKNDWVKKGFEDWAKEPVILETIDEAGIKELLKNNSGKLRLINVWATWCGPCIIEMPEFVTMNRMYRGRDFELVTICLDDPARKEKATGILKKIQASNKNYLFDMKDKWALIEAVDPQWQGALPYTLIVEPGGKIYYAKQYIIDPEKLKKMIVDHPLIGRYY